MKNAYLVYPKKNANISLDKNEKIRIKQRIALNVSNSLKNQINVSMESLSRMILKSAFDDKEEGL